jgi:hypothetical protein
MLDRVASLAMTESGNPTLLFIFRSAADITQRAAGNKGPAGARTPLRLGVSVVIFLLAQGIDHRGTEGAARR